MDDTDPISQFFPNAELVDLYVVLSVSSDASQDDIKKAYRRLALLHHPDKHANADADMRAAASLRFMQTGFAYSVLSDEKRRERYDRTGRSDEGLAGLDKGEDGWEAYFADMFERVTKTRLDELKKEYQGSDEEVADLREAYLSTDGSLDAIMLHIPHSTHEDEARFVVCISGLVSAGELERRPAWEASAKDEKGRLVRKAKAGKEAKEAEALARELGVWDEFYGSGKEGPRKGKGKGASPAKGKGKGKKKGKEDDEDAEEEDTSALQALILKRKKNMDGFFDNLAAKYAEPESAKGSKKGKKRAKGADAEESELPKKKAKISAPPEIDDEEFEKLQAKLFGDKAKPSAGAAASSGRDKKGAKGRKAK